MDFDTIFVDNRESGETQLRQCQLVMLRMLKILDYLCTKHGIDYFLMGGSLLGAIRHKGFIPWDDDLDVGMTRKNYEKFIRYAVPELPNDIFFQNQETEPNYPKCHSVEAKLRDKYSRLDQAAAKKLGYHDGLMLDIFVYDRAFLPLNKLIYFQNKCLAKLSGKKGHIIRAKILKFIANWIPLPFVYSNNFVSTARNAKLGTMYMTGKEIGHLKRVRFEDADILVPVFFENVLKRQYGDFMKLPPLNARKGHHGISPDPFTPCAHTQILYWKQRKKVLPDEN